MLGHPDPPPHLRLGIDSPEDFWHPVMADRFHVLAWDMWRVRVDHLDQMLEYIRKVPAL